MYRWFALALRLAKLSNHPKHKLAAVVVKGGSVLSQAVNLHTWGKHAERRALSACSNTEGATLIVARHNSSMSKPCPICLMYIKEAGISKIVYANWDSELCIESL